MRPENETRILEAAMAVFAESGYTDGSARMIAERADTTTMTMYRSFRNKEMLFEEALREAINRSFDPGKFALLMYEGEKQDFGPLLVSALERWYSGMPTAAARLLGHAYLSSKGKWREM